MPSLRCSATLLLLAVLLPLNLAAQAQAGIRFHDITKAAGIRFRHNTGAFGKKYLPETLGSGAAFLDYDNDGWPDILLVNGQDFPGHARRAAPSTLKLYHNNRNGTFTDVTARAGLAVSLYGMGVAVGDYDNDGYDDLFITALGQSRLFHNQGNGTFQDVTQAAGLGGVQEFSTSAAWVDYDRDGRLDLVVANYVQWTPATDLFCTLDGQRKSYCTPESYKGVSARLWHNRGNGKFEDATRQAGLWDPSSKALGIAVLDYDGDDWPDLVLANDTQPNKLYHNNGKVAEQFRLPVGTFSERGVAAGVAFSEEGIARAGMGVDAADYDRSGRPSIVISNFSNQMLALYHNEGNGLFVDEAPRSAVGRASLLTLGFGCLFYDYDLDGWLDLLAVNGHIEPEIQRIQKRVKYAQPPHLFRNLGEGKFAEATASVGAAFAQARVARGVAYADIDNDGDLDLLVTTNGGPALLFRNDGGTNHSLRVKLEGVRSNRDGIGARLRVIAGPERQWLTLRSGSSYLSQSELVLTIGLGQRAQADQIEISWPSGEVEYLTNVAAGQTVTVQEGKGIVANRKYGPAANAARAKAGAKKQK